MTQPASSSRLSNLSLNMIGANGRVANYGSTGIGVTGGNFDISSISTLTLGSTGNVTIGNVNGTVDITNGTVNLNTINGPTSGSTLRIGGNLVTGNLFLGATSGSTITVGGTGSTIILGTTGITGVVNGTFFANGDLVANTIKSSAATTAMTIGGNIGNSTIKIGEFTTGAAASVLLGSTSGTSSNALYGSTVQIGNASSTVNVGATGSAIRIGGTGGSVNVGATGTSVQIGGVNSTVNIGVTGTINVTSTSIQIGTGMRSGSIIIGDTSFPTNIYGSTLTLGGADSDVIIGNTGSNIYIGATGSTAFINGTVFIGASGSGNVTLGQSAIGSVILNGTTTLSGTTSVTTLDTTSATTAMSIGNNNTTGGIAIGSALTGGALALANGTGFTGNIRIGAGSTIRTGTINIGTGGSGVITIGNATCNTNAYNVYLDGGSFRMPRLVFRGSTVKTVTAGSSSQLITDITGYGTTYDLICIAFNGDRGAQPNMIVSAAVSATDLYINITNAVVGSARLSYAVYAI